MLLYGLINPVAVIPIYLHFVNRAVSARAHRVLLIASSAVAALLIAAAIFGRQILEFFNVELDDFRIAGGLLALVIAFDMFQALYRGLMRPLRSALRLRRICTPLRSSPFRSWWVRRR